MQTYNDTITDELGVPSLNEDQLKEIKELTDLIQEAKGDHQKAKAAQDLMNYIDGLKGWTWFDASQAIWYTNVLSGPTTWLITNPFANLTNLVSELAIDVKNNPIRAPFIFRRAAEGLIKGLVQAGDVLQTGYDPFKGKDYKTEATPLLERIRFKGGKLNPANYLKYVTRAMKAGDIIFYQALKEQKLAVLALQQARKHGRIEPNGDDLKTIYETLIKEDFDTAMDQASSEGFTGRDQKLRAYEIMEQYRPEYAVQEAENFAAKGTFNYKPTGTLGRVANSLNNMRRDLPAMNYIVPFVNTVINVANEYLNYHPLFGGIRYVRQATGWGKAKQRLSDEERARVGVKALVGTIAMAALFLLDDPEDEDSLFEITANGTGSTKKNYELERTGWRSYSIRIGDTWYSYKNTPLALPLATVGFMKDAQRYGKKPDVESIATIAAMGSLKFIMDLNTLSSLADFFSLFDKENISEYTSSFDQAKKQLTK
ncbi:MAG: hypothetical protein MN733_34160, partial [Nitrososphaera sp.]|nr:hypothetical protein [Nitrososphaera sp.]